MYDTHNSKVNGRIVPLLSCSVKLIRMRKWKFRILHLDIYTTRCWYPGEKSPWYLLDMSGTTSDLTAVNNQ